MDFTPKTLDPDQAFDFRRGRGSVLLIACGALAREIIAIIELNQLSQFDVQCLPAIWHNTPDKIPGGVVEKIRSAKATGRYQKIYVLYADCGTGGLLDRALEAEGVERIAGPHCYSFFSGNEAFARTTEDEITAFYLTDYLARQFDKLIWEGFGLSRNPTMRDFVFGNYEKVVYLAQTEDPELQACARRAAEKLGLAYEYRFTGYGDLADFLKSPSDQAA